VYRVLGFSSARSDSSLTSTAPLDFPEEPAQSVGLFNHGFEGGDSLLASLGTRSRGRLGDAEATEDLQNRASRSLSLFNLCG